MQKPIAYESIPCPNCGKLSSITLQDAGYFWLADACWRCPYCKDIHTTKDISEYEKKRGVTHDFRS